MWPNPQKTADLVIFTKKILDWNFHFLCSDYKEARFYTTYYAVFKGIKLVLEDPGVIYASNVENKKAFHNILLVIFKN